MLSALLVVIAASLSLTFASRATGILQTSMKRLRTKTIDMLMAQGNECYHKGQLDKALVCFTTIAARYNPEIHDSAY